MLERLYFIYNYGAENINEQVVIDIPRLIPDSVQYNYQPNFQSQSTLGRRSPIFLYTGGSKMSYGFSLKLHEDILDSVLITENGTTTKPDSIVALVDKLKMLAYPMTQNDGTISYPKIYFEIGELSGYGIVEVSAQWEKPYRNLRYIQANISFSVTVEKEIEPPAVISREESLDFAGLVYDYKINLNLTQEEAERLVQNFGPAYNGTVEDLIRAGDVTQFTKTIKEEIAIESYNYQIERLKNLNVLFTTEAGQNIAEDFDLFNEITNGNFDFTKLYTEDQTDAKIIKDIKDEFRDYLDYYYDEVSTDMTRDEYYLVLDSVFTVLENLQKYAEEIYGYGQSS